MRGKRAGGADLVVRTTRFQNTAGSQRTNLQLVASRREGGTVRQESRGRGHGLVCLLALVLESAWRPLVRQREALVSSAEGLSDLRRVPVVVGRMRPTEVKGVGRIRPTRYVVRTEGPGQASLAFQAVGVRPPERVTPLSGRRMS